MLYDQWKRISLLPLWRRLGLLVFLCFSGMAALYRVQVGWQHLLAWTSWLLLGAALPLTRGAGSAKKLGVVTAASHALTVWLFLVAPAAKAGISLLSLGALVLALSIGEGSWLGGCDLERGGPFLALSALTFPVAFWSGRTQAACLLAAFAAVLLPLAGFLCQGMTSRVRTGVRQFAAAVFLPGSITALAAAACLHAPPVGSFFEDGHGLLPASEYVRGELPYKDILPGHGLLADGLIQMVELRLFGDDYRGVARGNKVVGAFFWPCVYLLGAAATGSPALGFWTACLSFLIFPQFMFFRVMASLVSLALVLRAARIGKPRAWTLAGASFPIALLFAVDFCIYSAAAAVAALAVSRGDRRLHASLFLLGAALSAAAIAIPFAGLGILKACFYDTFVYLPRLLPVYALGAPPPPPSILSGLSSIELIASLADPNALYYWFLPAALLVTAVLVVRAPAVGVRGRVLLPPLVWFCAATLSVVERHHVGYPLFVAPASALLLSRWVKGYSNWRSLRGCLAIAVIAVVILAARPFSLLPGVIYGLVQSEPAPGMVALEEPPRVRGTLFSREEAAAIMAARSFVQSGLLSPGETWLDFANAPLLYYLFDRDCPIRFYEVPFYESREDQEGVIAQIAGNGHVRAVLMRTGRPSDAIDGVSNARRAPLVFQYILQEFHPAFARDGVEFWLRNPPRADRGKRRLAV